MISVRFRQSQVQYQLPMAGRSSMVPVPVNKSTPVSMGQTGSGGGGGGGQTDLHSSPVLSKGKDFERSRSIFYYLKHNFVLVIR